MRSTHGGKAQCYKEIYAVICIFMLVSLPIKAIEVHLYSICDGQIRVIDKKITFKMCVQNILNASYVHDFGDHGERKILNACKKFEKVRVYLAIRIGEMLNTQVFGKNCSRLLGHKKRPNQPKPFQNAVLVLVFS